MRKFQVILEILKGGESNPLSSTDEEVIEAAHIYMVLSYIARGKGIEEIHSNLKIRVASWWD